MKRKLSRKQLWIIQAVAQGNRLVDETTGIVSKISWLDMDQLLEALPYETTKESLQFSLRHLIKRGYLVNGEPETRRGRNRRILVPTTLALSLCEEREAIPACLSDLLVGT